MPLLIVGTLDTKGEEIALVRDLVTAAGVEALVMDVGVLDGGGAADVTADLTAAEVAEAGGSDLTALREGGDRGAALQTMSQGAAAITARLHTEGRLDGLLGLGGSGGSSIVAAAAAVLPVGVPKLLVSTMASGDAPSARSCCPTRRRPRHSRRKSRVERRSRIVPKEISTSVHGFSALR